MSSFSSCYQLTTLIVNELIRPLVQIKKNMLKIGTLNNISDLVSYVFVKHNNNMGKLILGLVCQQTLTYWLSVSANVLGLRQRKQSVPAEH